MRREESQMVIGDGLRYRKLGLADALSRPYDYPAACSELSFILRGAYTKLPKNLQLTVFHDVLAAFRLLPQIQTSSGISSANVLIQAAEAVLPKHRKALAVSEFKHAVIVQKRLSKNSHEPEDPVHLPYDVLVHIFNFLDLRSLVTVSFVNRGWKAAANDDMLWKSQCSIYFGLKDPSIESKEKLSTLARTERHTLCRQFNSDWRDAFQRNFLANPWSFASTRIYCSSCKELIWLSNLACFAKHQCLKSGRQSSKIKPILPDKVVEYLTTENVSSISSSDSDSDADESSFSSQRLPKLWAYSKHLAAKSRK